METLVCGESASYRTTNPGEPIVIPRDASDVHYEGELVIVMGRKARDVSKEEAREAIFGVTCGNDVSERNWQHGQGKDLQWWRAKGCDTFAPLGPWLVTPDEAGDALGRALSLSVNGHRYQHSATDRMIFKPAALIAYLSVLMTLEPGDVILSGTPEGVGSRQQPPVFLRAGDHVEVAIEGLGVQRQRIVAWQIWRRQPRADAVERGTHARALRIPQCQRHRVFRPQRVG